MKQQSFYTQNKKYADDGDIIVRCPMGKGRLLVACVLNDVSHINVVYGGNGDHNSGRSFSRSTVCCDGHIYARVESQRSRRRERKDKERFAARHDVPFFVGKYKTPYRSPQDEYEYDEEEYPLDQRRRSSTYHRDSVKLSRNSSRFATPSPSHSAPVFLNRPSKAEGEVSRRRMRSSGIALPPIRSTSPTAVNAQFLSSPRAKRESRLPLPPII
ncbi:hypothetical protein LSM04_009295 [Trypanosoma melophagium]|uniref:uncharacterized protein n=1 Tax=Trypanosoma melophagium TaxID=715481 RepID=UPI00351A4146|nr:hypothetical protein LSM04_009295 [Trypanosoma melophagium]